MSSELKQWFVMFLSPFVDAMTAFFSQEGGQHFNQTFSGPRMGKNETLSFKSFFLNWVSEGGKLFKILE